MNKWNLGLVTSFSMLASLSWTTAFFGWAHDLNTDLSWGKHFSQSSEKKAKPDVDCLEREEGLLQHSLLTLALTLRTDRGSPPPHPGGAFLSTHTVFASTLENSSPGWLSWS